MKLIVGLGNPGDKYKNNRHNVGFQFIDYLIENRQILNPKLQNPNKYQILNIKIQKLPTSTIYHLKSDLILIKPQTFMNKSGEAVKKIFGNWKLEIGNLVVVHDDLDIPLGKFKIQKGTGPQLHNGLESIENHLHSKDFWRVRIGVDNRPASRNTGEYRMNGEAYVLQDFSNEELTNIRAIFSEIFERMHLRHLV